MMMHRVWQTVSWLVIFVLIGCVHSVKADDDSTGLVGKRVRVSLSTEQVLPKGEVTKCQNDSLWLEIGEGDKVVRRVFSFYDIRKVEVSRGTHRNVLKGTLIGLGTGAMLGCFGGASASDDDFYVSQGTQAALGAAVLGAVGALVGTAVGAMSKTEKWEESSMQAICISLAPMEQNTVGLALSLKF